MKSQTLPKQIICPQLGIQPNSTAMQKARRKFNKQRWREDMRDAVATRNWTQAAWLEKHYETILSQ